MVLLFAGFNPYFFGFSITTDTNTQLTTILQKCFNPYFFGFSITTSTSDALDLMYVGFQSLFFWI